MRAGAAGRACSAMPPPVQGKVAQALGRHRPPAWAPLPRLRLLAQPCRLHERPCRWMGQSQHQLLQERLWRIRALLDAWPVLVVRLQSEESAGVPQVRLLDLQHRRPEPLRLRALQRSQAPPPSQAPLLLQAPQQAQAPRRVQVPQRTQAPRRLQAPHHGQAPRQSEAPHRSQEAQRFLARR